MTSEVVPSPRTPRWLLAACAIALAGTAVWSGLPRQPRPIEIPAAGDQETGPVPTEPPTLDLAAFQTPLWVAQAPPPPPPVAPPPPPPLKLQLIAIVEEGGKYRAAIYDPDKNELRIVAMGDTIGAHTVDEINKQTVRIRDGQLVRTLTLDTKQGAPS